MKEYIEKAAALEALSKSGVTCNMRAHKIVASIQAADVVEVVRCGECRHAEDSLVLWCHEHEKAVSRLDFCSHGARMGKEDEHET